jgi:hypothetical protein
MEIELSRTLYFMSSWVTLCSVPATSQLWLFKFKCKVIKINKIADRSSFILASFWVCSSHMLARSYTLDSRDTEHFHHPWHWFSVQKAVALFFSYTLFFFSGNAVWTQGLILARQALYCLSHSPALFVLGIVRNIFKILACHEREMTQLRSQQARLNLLLQKGAQQTKSKHTRQEVCLSFTSNAMLPLPWIGQVLDLQSMWLTNWKGDIWRGLWRQV